MTCTAAAETVADGMRLLAVVEYFPPVLGHDLRVYELARRLPAEWEVRFLVVPSLRRLMTGNGAIPRAGAAPERVVPVPIAIPRWIERSWRKSWMVSYLLTCLWVVIGGVRAAKRERPDLILANYPSPYTGLLAYAIGRLRSIPCVVDFCDDIVAYFETIAPKTSPPSLSRAARRVQDFLIRRSPVLPVVTRSLREYAIRKGVDPGAIEVLTNGVDLSLFDKGMDGSAGGPSAGPGAGLRCFYGGSLESWAGSTLLVELARRAEREGGGIELSVAGNPLPDSGVGLPSNLHHLGFLTKEGVVEALRRCDCVLVPLQPGMVADTTSPVKLFEGLAAGKPCICSRAAGICDVIVDGQNGLLMDSVDPEAWLRQIRALAADPALRERLAVGARTTSARYDWGVLAQRFGNLLKRSVDSG